MAWPPPTGPRLMPWEQSPDQWRISVRLNPEMAQIDLGWKLYPEGMGR